MARLDRAHEVEKSMTVKDTEPFTVAGATAPVPTAAQLQQSQLEGLETKQLTQFQLAWMRFRRHHLAMVGVTVLMLMTLMAIFAPWISPENIYNPMSADIFNAAEKAPTFSQGLRYIFGADFNGHSIAAQIIYGARFSLLIGFSSAVFSSLIGVTVGAVAGYFGGWVDSVLMRLVDVFLALPFLPVLLVAAAIFGGGHTSVLLVILILAFFGWAYVARLLRASFLTLRSAEYTEAARAVGVSNSRIMFRHMLPNALRPILVATTLAVASNIITEAAIDFLGLGLQYPDTSWGSVLSFAQSDPQGISGAPWVTIFPGFFLVATVVAVNFLGDGLSDALDVRMKD
jgi:peptide/nickel transport system permease protein